MTPPKPAASTVEDYWSLPEGVRAELIDGDIWNLASPSRKHQEIVGGVYLLLANFIREHDGPCKVYPAPFAVNLFGDESTLVEPDVVVVCDRDKLSDRGCEGAPDLIVEVVSPSDPKRDYVTKANLYLEAGVREYWICDPQEERTIAYDFEGDMPPMICPFSSPVASTVLPDLEVDFSAIVAGM